MAEPSPEADYCIVSKDTPIRSLQALCSELLAQCHSLLADESIAFPAELVPIVPVIVTNASLKVSRLDGKAVPLTSGKLDPGAMRLENVEIVRFRKSLVNERSNSYDLDPLAVNDWVVDRKRTVFVVKATALEGHKTVEGRT